MTKYTENEIIIPRNVEDEMKESYLRYSMSVIIARALPDVRDGLKPSQRRILFAMRQLNLSPGGKHRKCAKICGDTSGDYHPHGEQVIYPTLVRMAQNWAMRYSLVDGQGNFGSVDGDPPAAMRYTEARLTHSAIQLMDDLDKDTVDMVPNYDETKKEPTVFPSKFPNLICNGSSGIAVGMATNIPPQNLNELIRATLLLLDNSATTVEEILQVMPGPDFPTGGIICGYRGIREAYNTGRGKVMLRGVIRVEDNPDMPDRQRLAIDEIPYNVNKSRLIERIAELINEKTLNGISDLRDESDKDGMRIVLELKRNEIPDVTINQLYKFTDMQVTFGCNMLALDKGLPKVMNIKQMIVAWIEHRIEVVRRRTRFELNKAEARAHILQGYLLAIDHLDEVVKIIRSSDHRDMAKESLKSRFGFTEKQATAVLDLRLYQLTGLEHDKINEEYQELLKKIDYFKAVLASEEMVKDIIREELNDIQKHHKSERKTVIQAAEGEMNMEDLIADEQVLLTISEDDYIKRMPVEAFKEQRRGGSGKTGMSLKREDDAIKGLYVVSTHDYILIFTSLGRVYWLKAWQIPEFGRAAKGRPLVQLLEDIRPDEKIATVLPIRSLTTEGFVMFATKKGTVKKSRLDEFSNPRRKGVTAINLDEGDQLVSARFVVEGQQVMLFTYKGMAVRFDEAGARPMGRQTRGVKGVKLKDVEDYVVNAEVVSDDMTVLVVCENGFGKRTKVENYRQTKRGGVGVRSIITNDRNGNVVAALAVDDTDGMVMMSAKGQTVRISMKDLRVMGRNTQGVKLVQLKDDDWLLAVQKIKNGSEDGESTESTLPPETIAQMAAQEAMPEEVLEDEILEEELDETSEEESDE